MIVTKPADIMDVLRKLQALDDESRDIRVSRDAMVSSMERLQKVLNHLDRELVDKRDKLTEAETWNRTKTAELEAEREKLAKAKAKLSGVTRSKEYVAVNKELETVRKTITQREDEIKNLDTAVNEFRDAISREEQKVQDLRSQAAAEERSNKERLAVMDARIAEVDLRRKAITSRLDNSIVNRYARIAQARGGVAVVRVLDSACKGCNMILQPRFVENILRASSIVMCPHCSRYLYAETTHEPDGSVAAL